MQNGTACYAGEALDKTPTKYLLSPIKMQLHDLRPLQFFRCGNVIVKNS